MPRGIRGIRLALLTTALLAHPAAAVAAVPSSKAQPTTTVVRVEDKDEGGNVDEKTLLTSTLSHFQVS